MSRREQVKKAIRMQGPDYVPMLFFNKDYDQSDIIVADVVRHFTGDSRDMSEWGFKWERQDDTMGQPRDNLLKNWDDLNCLKIPDPFDLKRFDGLRTARSMYGDRYYLASLVLSGFTVMSCLRGFENILEDLYFNVEEAMRLADAVFGFEEQIICQIDNYGADGVAFYDDWGTQNSLIISPTLWRDFFKPRYRRQFDLAHRHGLDVYFHCCGYIYDIIGDLIEIGVDMLNLSQPNLFDIVKLGRDFGGRVCFVCPISYQTTSILGTKGDIYREAGLLIDNLGCHNGGLVGYVEEYHSIGLTDENYLNCINAFRELGKYKPVCREQSS